MVVVRLARGGNHNRPYFHVVATDSRARRDGRFIEKLGFYNPLKGDHIETFRINQERLDYWVTVGAAMSPTVKKLLKAHNKAVSAKASA